MTQLDKEVTLKYTDHFINTVYKLNRTISTLEWSGVLFYKVLNEQNLNFTLELVDIYLMDIGSVTSTSYKFDNDIIDYFTETGYIEQDVIMGHIHSHNKMSVFFSGTDISEVEDNSKYHRIYLSVIVNNNMDLTYKLTIKEKITYNIVAKGVLEYNTLQEREFVETKVVEQINCITGPVLNISEFVTKDIILERLQLLSNKPTKQSNKYYDFDNDDIYFPKKKEHIPHKSLRTPTLFDNVNDYIKIPKATKSDIVTILTEIIEEYGSNYFMKKLSVIGVLKRIIKLDSYIASGIAEDIAKLIEKNHELEAFYNLNNIYSYLCEMYEPSQYGINNFYRNIEYNVTRNSSITY